MKLNEKIESGSLNNKTLIELIALASRFCNKASFSVRSAYTMHMNSQWAGIAGNDAWFKRTKRMR